MTVQNLRTLAITLLDDQNGISEAAYNELKQHLFCTVNSDILDAVTATEGRYYLHEDVAESLRTVKVD
jgi:hypothetical protein